MAGVCEKAWREVLPHSSRRQIFKPSQAYYAVSVNQILPAAFPGQFRGCNKKIDGNALV